LSRLRARISIGPYYFDPRLVDGYVVSNSFELSAASNITGLDFETWTGESSSDVLDSVGWSISSSPIGAGTTYGSGTGTVTQNFVGLGYASLPVFDDSFSIPSLALPAGAYYINLDDAVTSPGSISVFWLQVDPGTGASSAYGSAYVDGSDPSGSIPVYFTKLGYPCGTTCSEAFQIVGTTGTPEPATAALFGAGLIGIGLAGARRRGRVSGRQLRR
jgi:hypothetical protein